jgi:alkaline phosphatase
MIGCVGVVVLAATLFAPYAWAEKNVIVMIPDGCSISIQTLARWYKGKALALDGILVGAVRTYAANSVITDSAAAVTAFATGHKSTCGFLSVGPRTKDLLTGFKPTADPYKPLATVLEGARLKGKATGLVATSRVSHATPAGYACHIHDRDLDNEIMEQMVYQEVDVVFGGGKQHLLPTNQGGKRKDGENLLQVLRERGYQFVETQAEMAALAGGKAWGLFASDHMAADIDRAEFAPTQPSLADMAAKAIELLCEDREGFFLLVEGSQVDWAGHANDPIHMLTDFLAFDRAVEIALNFAEADGDTLVIAFPDHNTGGLSIGHGSTSVDYTKTTVEALVAPLMRMRITADGLSKKIGGDLAEKNIREKIREWWGINAASEDAEEVLYLHKKKGLSLKYALGEVVSRKHTVLGWTTHGHSGEDVPLWAYGPSRPLGLVDNTQLAAIVAAALGFDLGKTTGRLFVDADEAYAGCYVLDKTDPENPVLLIQGRAKLPVGKDILVLDSLRYNLEGIVVRAPTTGKVYLPQEAVNVINSAP